MKKTISFLTLAAFILLFSCAKNDIEPTAPDPSSPTGDLKDLVPVNIMVAQNIQAGMLLVENLSDGIQLTALINGWEFLENHIYVGTEEPPSNAPGQFPYAGTIGYPATIVNFFVSYDDLGASCGTFYIAFYAEVTNGDDTEGAWAIHSTDPIYWLNPAGKPKGWGAYFAMPVSCGPQIEVTMTTEELNTVYGHVRYTNMSANTDEVPEVLLFPNGMVFPPYPVNFSSTPDCPGNIHSDGQYLFNNQPNHILLRYIPDIGFGFGTLESTIDASYYYCIPPLPSVLNADIDAIQLYIQDLSIFGSVVLTNVKINNTDIEGDFAVLYGDGDVRFNFTGDILSGGGFIFQADLLINEEVPEGSFDMNFVEVKFGLE